MKKAILVLLFYLSISGAVCGQELDWLNTVKGEYTDPLTPNAASLDLKVDNDNNTYLLGAFKSAQLNTTSSTRSSVIKYDEKGKLCWYKNFDYSIITMDVDDSSNCFFAVQLDYGSCKIGNDSYNTSGGIMLLILAKADSAFNIKWTRELASSSFGGYNAEIIATDNEVLLHFNRAFLPNNSFFKFKGKQYSFPLNKHHCILLKLDKNKAGSNGEWCTSFYGFTSPIYDEFETDMKEYIYLDISHISPDTLFINDSICISDTAGYPDSKYEILKFSLANGSFKGTLNIDYQMYIHSKSVLASGKIFVSGTIPAKFNYRGVSYDKAQPGNLFILMDNNGNPLWSVRSDLNGRVSFLNSKERLGYIYCYGILRGNINIGGFLVQDPAIDPVDDVLAFAKLDTVGNCLWAFSTLGGSSWRSQLDIDLEGNSYYSNAYNDVFSVLDTIVYGDRMMVGYNSVAAYKINDFAITRGNVYPGPYCAGDTIEIPYTLKGKFDPTNVFIAQLSDENGDFFGGERELGRLKSNKDGVVKGILPLFNVETSGKYRIRILSTKPAAQSFYRRDSLRLLIYSRDTANAGPDTIICNGQSVNLRTTGGSKRHWSPAVFIENPEDSANKRLTVKPDTTVVYRVIISDSSGCGVTDTDYVAVTVRPPLRLDINKDTTICYKGTVNLNAAPSGGKPENYRISWADGSGQWTDTNYSAFINPVNTSSYRAILWDNCTVMSDTQNVVVTVRPPLSLTIGKDDSICQKQLVLLSAAVSGGDSTQRKLEWTKNTSFWTSLLNPETDTPLVTTTYTATLSDNCSPQVKDSFRITVFPLPIGGFEVDITEGCPPMNITFTDTSKFNDISLNSWTIDSKEGIGTAVYTHVFSKPGIYGAVLKVRNSFGCADYVSKPNLVTVFPKPTASFFIKPQIKEVEEPLLLYNTSQNSNTYSWDFGNGNTLKQYNRNDTTYTYADSGTYTIRLIAENDKGCRDTTSQVIKVFDKIYCAIPSAFTPNSDNVNPVFTPVCTGVAHYTLTIYNRWGGVLYDCENCSWDGTHYGAPVINEVYMYKIQLQGENRKKSTVFGTVHVIR